MELVPRFVSLLQGLSVAMIAPTIASLTTVLPGWVFTRLADGHKDDPGGGDAAGKHFLSYHRLFRASQWSFDAGWQRSI